SGLQVALLGIALLLGREFGDVIQRRRDAMLGEPALLDLDLAAAAYAPAAADAPHIYAELARRFQHGRADRKSAALAGWHEEHQRILDHFASFTSSWRPARGAPQSVPGSATRHAR